MIQYHYFGEVGFVVGSKDNRHAQWCVGLLGIIHTEKDN